MMSRIATCLGVAAILAACGGDNGNDTGTTGVNPPSVPTGSAAGSGATPPVQQPMAASNPTPMAMPPAQTPGMQTPPAQTPPGQTPSGQPGMQTPPTQTPGMQTPPAQMPPAMGPKQLAMDECGLKTMYPGDNYCINPPEASKGFQMHIGPSNYNSPEAKYVLQPGGEVTENFPVTSGNTEQIYYYWRQYRMRPGSHHLIISEGAGRRLGGSSNAAKDNPEAGVIAPENKGVGMRLAPRTTLNNSLHYFNFTDKPVIKEVWVNFWYRDASEVTEPTSEVFSMLGMGIRPGEHVLVQGSCPVTGSGRMLTAYGHVHANNHGFKVWRTRSNNKMLVHQAFDWEHPGISEYSSTVMNPPLDPMGKMDGGYSGVLDIKAGDKIEFECDIINNTDSTFLGLNEAENDEMCILIGDTVGATISRACTQTNVPAGSATAR